jgi:hypothetical protein
MTCRAANRAALRQILCGASSVACGQRRKRKFNTLLDLLLPRMMQVKYTWRALQESNLWPQD